MEENTKETQNVQAPKTTAGQGFGIAGLVIGILALVLAFIPCIGVFALAPGAIAIALSIIGLIQANQGNGAKGLIIAALVISILATSIAAIWGLFLGGVARDGHKWKDRVEHYMETADRESFRELEKSLRELGTELEKTFGHLEEFDPEVYEFDEEITDAEFNRVLREYEEVVEAFVGLTRERREGDLPDLVKYSSASLKAASLAATLIRVGPRLTDEQRERFEAVHKKYEEALDEIQE